MGAGKGCCWRGRRAAAGRGWWSEGADSGVLVGWLGSGREIGKMGDGAVRSGASSR